MNKLINTLLNDFSAGGNAPEGSLEKIMNIPGVDFPDDYLSFMKEIDGGEGFIGEEYLILWKMEELEEFNEEYEVTQYAPGIFLFGSNGSGEGFGFDTRKKPYQVVQIPFIGMDIKYASYVADNFNHLLERMEQSDGSLL